MLQHRRVRVLEGINKVLSKLGWVDVDLLDYPIALDHYEYYIDFN